MPPEFLSRALALSELVPHALLPSFLRSKTVFSSLDPITAHHSVSSVSTSLHLHSLFSSPQQNSVSPDTLQPSSARVSAASSTQILHPILTQNPGTQNSATESLQQQKEILTTSPTEYKIAFRQARMMKNEPALCFSTVTSESEALQRDVSKLTAENESFEQLNKKLMENAILAFQKKVERSLMSFVQPYLPPCSA